LDNNLRRQVLQGVAGTWTRDAKQKRGYSDEGGAGCIFNIVTPDRAPRSACATTAQSLPNPTNRLVGKPSLNRRAAQRERSPE